MSSEKPFQVAEFTSLRWPSALVIPSRRFRLFVAADVMGVAVDVIGEFAHSALAKGMVHFCAWGPDCERFHDIVDEIVTLDEIGERRFAAPNGHDTIMTTGHDRQPLDEALDFFVNWSLPNGGFQAGSAYWLAISVGNPKWTATIKQYLEGRLI